MTTKEITQWEASYKKCLLVIRVMYNETRMCIVIYKSSTVHKTLLSTTSARQRYTQEQQELKPTAISFAATFVAYRLLTF